jgi:hypothetical protein
MFRLLRVIIRPSTELSQANLCINAEDVFKLLDCHDHAQPCCSIWKQSTFEEAEEPLPDPRERTMAVSELTESLGSLKLASACLRALIQMSSEQRKLQDACLL